MTTSALHSHRLKLMSVPSFSPFTAHSNAGCRTTKQSGSDCVVHNSKGARLLDEFAVFIDMQRMREFRKCLTEIGLPEAVCSSNLLFGLSCSCVRIQNSLKYLDRVPSRRKTLESTIRLRHDDRVGSRILHSALMAHVE